ncbi:MAG: WYL domain-containing protein [Rhodospirillales bacterium]|nr:WYL domain-containing protein [Rhodospirillales bacterium]MCB9996252.1 WYL domain-containing protein [Rhodospirillales bacterium]
MENASSKIRWGAEKRLEFIEFRLFWEGAINRSDITDFFGVSVPQASNDLSDYKKLAPENVFYDSSNKKYVATESFQPRLIEPSSDQYLSQLELVTSGMKPKEECWISNIPSAEFIPVPHRRVDIDVLRTIIIAIQKEKSLEIKYQSMNDSRPAPVWRRVTPHAFGNDGFRWHIRAFCHIDNIFKDFLLSRCFDARNLEDAGAKANDDRQWNEFIDVVLIPNPELSDSQRKAIAHDYEMRANKVKISIRQAFLYYFKKRLRLDVAEHLDNAQEAPVIIENMEEFEQALEAA